MLKSDNVDAIGQHCFERKGLGTAPFRVIGFSVSKYQPIPDAPALPGSSCDYCGMAIMLVCHIRGVDGKAFKVGSDCVNKTGDDGLIKAYKQTKEYRAHQKALRNAKDERNKAEIARFLADEIVTTWMKAQTFTTSWGKATNKLEAMQKSLAWCGAKGRSEWVRTLRTFREEAYASPVS
jgi:hypothetical protein